MEEDRGGGGVCLFGLGSEDWILAAVCVLKAVRTRFII